MMMRQVECIKGLVGSCREREIEQERGGGLLCERESRDRVGEWESA